jgi:uncharacterized FlaG/YvyC family protein
MNVNLAVGATSNAPQAGGPSGSDHGALVRELAQAVEILNETSVSSENHEYSLSFDRRTKLPVVRVMDSITHEVIEQLPTEDVLRVTAFLQAEAAQECLSKVPAPVR